MTTSTSVRRRGTKAGTRRAAPARATTARPTSGSGTRAGAKPRMDPRIRARRVEVARAAGRRRLRRLGIAAALTLAVLAATGLVLSPLLDVDHVVVVGAGARASQVRAAAAVDRGAPLLLVDTGAVEDRVSGLSWVADARVERALPGTLRIRVRTRPPVAFAPRPDGRVAVVDPTGTVVAIAGTAPAGLPAIVTTSPPPRAGARIHPPAAGRVAAALGPLAGRITRISVDHHAAALLTTDGTEVRLGALVGLREKARAASAVLGALPGRVVYVDVSVPSAPVTG
jgi:cell division protein FtsQ